MQGVIITAEPVILHGWICQPLVHEFQSGGLATIGENESSLQVGLFTRMPMNSCASLREVLRESQEPVLLRKPWRGQWLKEYLAALKYTTVSSVCWLLVYSGCLCSEDI